MVGHKHSEVVDMIRDSSFVTLTLIGKLGPNGTAKGILCVCVCVCVSMFVCLCLCKWRGGEGMCA